MAKNFRIQVFVDFKYVFSCSTNFVIDHRLYKGKTVTAEEIEKLKTLSQDSLLGIKLEEYAMRGKYSKKQLKDKVNEYSFKRFKEAASDNFFTKAFVRLEEYGMYSEETIVKRLVEELKSKSKGGMFIQNKLRSVGFDKDVIQNILTDGKDEDEEDKTILELIAKKKRSVKSNDPKAKEKIIRFCISKGFDYQRIMKLMKYNK